MLKYQAALIGAWLLLAGQSLSAQSWLDPWIERDRLTGDWGGARTAWQENGIDLDLQYTFNAAGNVSGGTKQSAAYADDATAFLHLDLEKALGFPAAKFHLMFNSRNGRSLSNDAIGSLFQTQQLFGGGELVRLGEISLEFSFLNEAINFKAGRIFGGADFAASPLYGNFMNQAMDGNLGSLGKDINLSFWPVASWGGRLQVHPHKNIMVQAGLFEANPSLSRKHGFAWSTNGATGVIFMSELWFKTEGIRDWLPGTYKLGFYYDSSEWPDLYRNTKGAPLATAGGNAKMHDGKVGVYVLVDQMVWRDASNHDRYLTLLGGCHLAPDYDNFMPGYAFGGFLANGLIEGRNQDTLGYSFSYGTVSRDQARTQRLQGAPAQNFEMIMELNYGIQAAGWLRLLPNMQYIVRPGGTGTIENALVFGLQTSMQF